MTLVPADSSPVLAELAEHEQVIERGLATFVEVGMALFAIKKNPDLYRAAGYATFEGYLEERWNISRFYGYRLITAATTATKIIEASEADGTLPIGNTVPRPTAESQVRPLARLSSDEEKREAWAEAVDRSGGQVPTASTVEAVVAEMTAPEPDDDGATGSCRPYDHRPDCSCYDDEDIAEADEALAEAEETGTSPLTEVVERLGIEVPASRKPTVAERNEAVAAAVDDGSIAALRYRRALTNAIGASSKALAGFDEARVAEVCEHEDFELIEMHARYVADWAARLLSKRPKGLRVVSGGAR